MGREEGLNADVIEKLYADPVAHFIDKEMQRRGLITKPAERSARDKWRSRQLGARDSRRWEGAQGQSRRPRWAAAKP
jgi:hypothetical protein